MQWNSSLDRDNTRSHSRDSQVISCLVSTGGLGGPDIPQRKKKLTHVVGKSTHLLSKAKLYKQRIIFPNTITACTKMGINAQKWVNTSKLGLKPSKRGLNTSPKWVSTRQKEWVSDTLPKNGSVETHFGVLRLKKKGVETHFGVPTPTQTGVETQTNGSQHLYRFEKIFTTCSF